MIDVIMKSGDTLPSIKARIFQADGAAVDLTSCSVVFSMRTAGANGILVITEEPCVVLTPARNGRVEFFWPEGSTDVSGEYEGEFDVTLYSGAHFSAPTKRYLTIKIYDDIDE